MVRRLSVAAGGMVLLGPAVADACSVCMGARGQPVTEAAGGAILFLLTLVMFVLAAVGAFAFRLFLRGRKMAAGEKGGGR